MLGWILSLGLGACVLPSSPSETFTPARESLFDPALTWRDETGAVVSLARWGGTPVVVTPFYTTCTLRCPMTIQALRRIDAAYHAVGAHAEFVLITIDPRTDSPARLARFKASHAIPAEWHLLSGGESQTREASRLLGVHAARDEGHIDHDVRIVVFDGAGGMARSADGWDFDPASMVVVGRMDRVPSSQE
jgi:protein SCO1/2